MANPYNPNDLNDRGLNDPYARERIADSGSGMGLFAGLAIAAVLIIGGLFMYYHNDSTQTASNEITTSAPGSRAPVTNGAPGAAPTTPSPSTPAPATPPPSPQSGQ